MAKPKEPSFKKGVVIREDDNTEKRGIIAFLEYDENNIGVKLHKDPAIGRTIIVNPNKFWGFTWMTTKIIKIMDDNKIKTENNIYNIKYEE